MTSDFEKGMNLSETVEKHYLRRMTVRNLTFLLLSLNNLVLGWAIYELADGARLVNERLLWLKDNLFDITITARENDYLVHQVIDYIQTWVQPIVMDAIGG